MHLRILRSWIAAAAALAVASGQQVSGPQSNLVAQSGALKVTVVQGEGAMNSIRGKTATAPVVEVKDANDKPVEGAEVVFQLPAAGPGGMFHGWMRTQTTRTDAQGRATVTGYTPNDEEGRFNIKVTASQGNRTGTVVIGQSNVRSSSSGSSAKSGHSGMWKVLAVVGAGALAGGIYYAVSHDGGSTPAPGTAVTILPGPITVAAPH